jgi:hypothetical protein
MDITDVCRISHSETVKYTFFSAALGTFSKIDHILMVPEFLTQLLMSIYMAPAAF